MYKSYELNLIESDCFDMQILTAMYDDAKDQFPVEAKQVMDEYSARTINRPEAYERMKQLLKQRKFN